MTTTLDESKTEPRPQPRGLQFNTRTLLGAMLIVCFVLAWWIDRRILMNRIEQVRAEDVKRQDEQLTELKRAEEALRRVTQSNPVEKIASAGAHVSVEPYMVTLSDKLTDEHVAEIANWKSIRMLGLHSPNLTTECLRCLDELPKLENVSMSGDWLDDTAVGKWGPLPNVRGFGINRAVISDKALQAILATVPNVEELLLQSGKVGDATIGQLTELKRLQILTLNGTPITDEHCRQLATLPVHTLRMSSVSISDKALIFIGQMPELKDLTLTNMAVTDAGLVHLANAPKLQRLFIAGLQVKSVESLRDQLPKLTIETPTTPGQIPRRLLEQPNSDESAAAEQ